ncbi:unnamed protein product, partial [Symbiodinium sp. KB8]
SSLASRVAISFSAASYSAAEIQAAVSVLQGALDAGADLAIYFGGWSPLQRRALAMSLGSAEAAVAEAKASAKTSPPVKKAPAAPPAKPASPAPSSSTVTQPAPEPLGHLDGSGAADAVGFQSVEHAEMAAAMNYASATAFYAAMAAASSTDGPGGALGGYLSELQAKEAEDRRMRELQERIAGEIQQDAADRAASGSGSRPPQTQQAQQQAPEQTGPPNPAHGGFPAPAPAWARYPNANRMRYRQIVDDRMALCSAEWRHHIRDMHLAGAESTEPIVDPDLQQLAVANMTQLAAAYFFLRKLPPGVRGMRVPERLTGEVWVIGAFGQWWFVAAKVPTSATWSTMSTTSARSAIGRAGAAGEVARGDRFPGTRHTMPAVDLHGRDGFALLARAFVELGAKEHLPALPAAGAHDVASALASASALVQAGVPAEVLVSLASWHRDHTGTGSSTDRPGSEALVISSTPPPGSIGRGRNRRRSAVPGDEGPPPDPAPVPPGRRGDLPVRREVRRACKRSALEAALAEHRQEALADLDENVLAVRSVAASLRRGGYRSAQNYFDAAVAYQERPARQAAEDLPGGSADRPGGDAPTARAWSPWTAAHAADALLLAAWFMLREIEFAAARTQDLEATGGTVTLRVPLHKAATGGQTELTMRQLRCAYHSAVRHIERLKAAGVWFRDLPLFPDGTGATWEKSSAILLFRRVLMAAGIQTTAVDHTGAPVQLFGEHLARVAGASWLASKGVPTPVIQLLGRWSSAAVERYIQAAPWPPRQDTSPAEFSPVVDFVPEPTPDPAALAAATGTAPEHYIYNAKALRVHAADPAEASADRFLWKTKGCSWPYGVRAFYRITDKPADAAWCLRCFPQFRDKPAPGSPTEEAESPVASRGRERRHRRGEDWRRAGHNATVKAHDVPTHHFVDDYVDIIRRVVELVGPAQAEALRIFCHDLLNAYRQWPVKEPAHSGTFLPAPNGVTMGFHMAMCFGAAASVWNFNRTADALQALKRVLLWIVSGHYVDDFNGVDLDELAPGAFEGMAEFLDQLGLQTKPSKAQKPATEHIVQGVLVSITRAGVVLQPTPARLQKVLTTIDTALAEDELAPDVASRLAGRLNFVTQSTFGAVGKAALQPVYARAHDVAAASDTRLSMGLRAALLSLRHLLANIQPKVVPYVDDGMPQAIIYADAFYKPGEVRHKAGHIPAEVAVKPGTRGQNGWGYVVRIGGDVYYDYGVAPAEFLHVFAARKAFIYVLEILAQVLALVTMGCRLPQRWLAFIDNVAGQWDLEFAVNGAADELVNLAA